MVIPVLFCIDGNYWQHLGVSIASLLETNPRNVFRIIVVSASEMDHAEVVKLSSLVEPERGSIETIVYSQAAKYQHLPTHSHLTFAMYLRLFMTEYLDQSLDKVLYLDSDIVICSDISDLWNISLEDCYLGAAPEPYDERQREPLGFSSTDLYINSGVMLIDLKKWRSNNVLSEILSFAQDNQHALVFSPDQDLINSVFRGKIKNIGYQWNWQALFPRFSPSELSMDKATFASLKRSPRLVHFTSRYKPWFYRWEPHYKDRYHRVLARTPWSGYHPPDKNLRNLPLHLIRVLQRKLEWHFPQLARSLRNIKGSSSEAA